MPAIFNALPGFEVPMGSVLTELASLWEMGAPGGKSAPSEYRASQMNFVLHLGWDHTPETARELFDSVLRFAQRYPCRIVALCPRMLDDGEDRLSAKVFGECFIGNSRGEMSCCEAIIVGYPSSQRGFLENQVTTLIETDLPLYYWPSRIRSGPKIGDYGFFLNHATRIVIDTAIENETVANFDWPRPDSVRDLAEARVLQVRQSVGQFLSSYTPTVLVTGLDRVEVKSPVNLKAEGGHVFTWLRAKLAECRERAGSDQTEPKFERTSGQREGTSIGIDWVYEDERHFSWVADFKSGRAVLRADFGGGPVEQNSIVRLLSTEKALGEALFF